MATKWAIIERSGTITLKANKAGLPTAELDVTASPAAIPVTRAQLALIEEKGLGYETEAPVDRAQDPENPGGEE